jgi:hypothetical protein
MHSHRIACVSNGAHLARNIVENVDFVLVVKAVVDLFAEWDGGDAPPQTSERPTILRETSAAAAAEAAAAVTRGDAADADAFEVDLYPHIFSVYEASGTSSGGRTLATTRRMLCVSRTGSGQLLAESLMFE